MKKITFCLILSFFLKSTLGFCTWEPVTTIITDTVNEFTTPQIALNNSGYAIAVWAGRDTGTLERNLFASNSQNFGFTWPTVITIDSFNPSDTFNVRPQIAMDQSNHAIVIWQRWNAANYEIKVTSFGESFMSITTLDTNAGSGIPPRPQIAMDELGHAIAIWTSENGAIDQVNTATSSDYGVSWSINPTPLDTTPDEMANAQITMDESGNAIAIWQFSTLPYYFIKTATSSDYGNSWSNIQTVDSLFPNASAEGFPQIVLDSSGHAIATWSYFNLVLFETKLAASSDFGVTWPNVTFIAADPASADNAFPQIATDNSGNSIVIWQETSGGGDYVVKAAISSNYGITWPSSTITTLDSTTPSPIRTFPQVEIDDFGNALAIWITEPADRAINRSNSSNFGASWSTPLITPIINHFGNTRPEIAIDKYGNENAINAIAIWTTDDTGIPISSIETSHFQQITISLSAIQENIKLFLQTEITNKIFSEAIGQQGTFRLYKNAALTQLISSVSNSHQLVQFIDNNIKNGSINSYFVTWTDAFGNVTGPVSITITD